MVDNGSRDQSAAIARQLGATVVEEAQQGFGAACWRGLVAADTDIVAFCDADASLEPRQLPVVTSAVTAGDADLVPGRCRPSARGAWPAPPRDEARRANTVSQP